MDDMDNMPKISIKIQIDDVKQTQIKAAEAESVVIVETEAETIS